MGQGAFRALRFACGLKGLDSEGFGFHGVWSLSVWGIRAQGFGA